MDSGSLYMMVLVNLSLGMALGYVLHRSDYCMAGMFRDFFLFRRAFMLRTLLLLVICSMVLIELARLVGLLPLHPSPLLKPPGFTNLIGGIIFGFGMVLAGGCVVGVVYKMGSGSVLSGVAFFGLLGGSALYAEFHPWWKGIAAQLSFLQGTITVPQLFGVSPTLVVFLVALPACYLLFGWFQKGWLVRKGGPEGYLQPWKAAVLFSVLSLISLLLLGLPFGITTSYAKMAAYIERFFFPVHYADVVFFQAISLKFHLPLTAGYLEGGPGAHFDLIWAKEFFLFLGIVVGAAGSALLLREFTIHFRVPLKQYLCAFTGGILLALASRMAPACNVLHLLGGLPVLALSSLLFFAGLFPGAWLGTVVLSRYVITE